MSENNTNPNQNWRTEEEAIALASGVSVEEAAAMVAGAPAEDRTKERNAVAAAFREELKHAGEPGAKVMSADRELRYCLELQRDRIADRSLVLEDEMTPGANFKEGLNKVRSWTDGQYETSWSVGFVDHKKTFSRANMKTYKHREPQAIYETVVDVRAGEDVSSDTYCCPNCGSVSTIRELQEGCSQCGTSFKMSELYPKVTNYFFSYDPSGRKDPIWKTIIKFGLYALPVTIPLFLLIFVLEDHFGALPGGKFQITPQWLIFYIIGMVITSPIFGYFIWILSIFGAAGRQISTGAPAFSVGNSRKRFAAKMAKISSEYTFEKFSSRITSLFKLVVFSSSRENLPFYEGGDMKEEFDNVIDCSFSGWMSCKKVKEEGNHVYVTGDLFVENTRDLGDRIKAGREAYRIKAGRRTDVPITSNFSIAKIQCRNCGASFNAFKSRNCPYCGTKSEVECEDWVIYEIRNIGNTYLIKPLIITFSILALVVLAELSNFGYI
ncbi:MAG: hypothetical protein IK020_04520 [Clostridiales bacterium]|nr:hypothetical protein [Clostridiales bacterium]